MSRLSEILGVKEGQEFTFDKNGLRSIKYKIENGKRMYLSSGSWEVGTNEDLLVEMITHPEKIKIIPQKLQLTEQQITVIKGRVAEGWNWIARNKFDTIYYYKKIEPTEERGYFLNGDECQFVINPNLFDFVTYENSPIYLPNPLGDENNE